MIEALTFKVHVILGKSGHVYLYGTFHDNKCEPRKCTVAPLESKQQCNKTQIKFTETGTVQNKWKAWKCKTWNK